MNELRTQIYRIHDVDCNQKYADTLPYSFHLKVVRAQGEKFIRLVKYEYITNPQNKQARYVSSHSVVEAALDGHDLIEDGRQTYNDLIDLGDYFGNYTAAVMFADIVYAVTDEKGKSRSERKSDKYYQELSENKLAIFVKLADIAANTLFSKLTGSSMYTKYKSEFAHVKEKLYIEEYKEFFDYIENL